MTPSAAPLYRTAKRMLDILVATMALLLLLPLFLGVALMIYLTDRGPVLYWQTRAGKRGRSFVMPKFRSMVIDAEALRAKLVATNQHGAAGVTFKIKRDPRITWIGRVIRRFSIDELPQLWCVLCGDMTLVGPRPALVSEVDRYGSGDRIRLAVKPGLTCIWQVSGRSELAFSQQVQLDARYVARRSMALDLSLLLRTVPAVLSGRGAY
jgi:lipopolysaccharide/colanic/teichoic acid biosynthesis glycosyltransferase